MAEEIHGESEHYSEGYRDGLLRAAEICDGWSAFDAKAPVEDVARVIKQAILKEAEGE